MELMKRAIKDPRGFGNQTVEITDEMLKMLAAFANGDARTALGTLEMVVLNGHREGDKTTVTMETLEQCISRKSLLYDKTGEEHYNIISALHKSMRNSDPDAAVYWLSRMLEAGEDPLYVARRLIGSRARTWAWRTAARWRSPWRRIRRAILSVCRSAR